MGEAAAAGAVAAALRATDAVAVGDEVGLAATAASGAGGTGLAVAFFALTNPACAFPAADTAATAESTALAATSGSTLLSCDSFAASTSRSVMSPSSADCLTRLRSRCCTRSCEGGGLGEGEAALRRPLALPPLTLTRELDGRSRLADEAAAPLAFKNDAPLDPFALLAGAAASACPSRPAAGSPSARSATASASSIAVLSASEGVSGNGSGSGAALCRF